jgi:hypothetical protein
MERLCLKTCFYLKSWQSASKVSVQWVERKVVREPSRSAMYELRKSTFNLVQQLNNSVFDLLRREA